MSRHKISFWKVTVIVIAASLLFPFCVSVKPYERQYLSNPGMKPPEHSMVTRYESHWRTTVEAQDLSADAQGGGCACK